MTRRWLITGMFLAGAALIVAAVLWHTIGSLTAGLCGNTPLQTVVSPDRKREAVLFERNCGATTDFSGQLSVLAVGEGLPDGPGNIFIAERGEFGSAAPWGGPEVAVRWKDERTLEVRYDPFARISKMEPTLEGIRISYEPID